MLELYNTHGHKVRFPLSEKAQFVTESGIDPKYGENHLAGRGIQKLHELPHRIRGEFLYP
jgi:hypothetical protein